MKPICAEQLTLHLPDAYRCASCTAAHIATAEYGICHMTCCCLLAVVSGADEWPRYSVMVASDAIGMGLNLNIRR